MQRYRIIIIPEEADPPATICGAFLLFIFMILHFPDLPIWAMIAISLFCGYFLTTLTAVFVLGWVIWSIYSIYS